MFSSVLAAIFVCAALATIIEFSVRLVRMVLVSRRKRKRRKDAKSILLEKVVHRVASQLETDRGDVK
jgi:hypothetical protein